VVQETLEEKGQYVTITFTTTCNYLVFATKFLLLLNKEELHFVAIIQQQLQKEMMAGKS
jgi:hypothetical protein